MDKWILLCLVFLARTSSQSASVPSAEAALMGPPTAYILKTAVPFSLECTTGGSHRDLGNWGQWVCEPPPSLHAACPLGCKITVPRNGRGWAQHGWGCWAATQQRLIGREQLSLGPHGNRRADYSMQQRKRELLTVFGGLERVEGRRGRQGGCQAVLFMEVWEDSRGGVLPTQRQLGWLSTTPLFPRLNEKSCWVEWERGQERSDSAGQAWMLAPRKGVRQMGSGPVGWGRGGGEETEGREMRGNENESQYQRLGPADATTYIQQGSIRFYCTAQESILNVLWETTMEKRIKKRMYTCITESLCCTAETNNIVNQLHFNFKKQITASRKSKKKCSTRRRKERKTDQVTEQTYLPSKCQNETTFTRNKQWTAAPDSIK